MRGRGGVPCCCSECVGEKWVLHEEEQGFEGALLVAVSQFESSCNPVTDAEAC